MAGYTCGALNLSPRQPSSSPIRPRYLRCFADTGDLPRKNPSTPLYLLSLLLRGFRLLGSVIFVGIFHSNSMEEVGYIYTAR